MRISKSRVTLDLVVSALLLTSGAGLAQDPPASPTKQKAGGTMEHDKMMEHHDMMPGMQGDRMKGHPPASSCMSKDRMQKMGMGQKKMAEMGAKCRAEKMRGAKPTATKPKPKPDEMKPMPMDHEM